MANATCYTCNEPIEGQVFSCLECCHPHHRRCLDEHEICELCREESVGSAADSGTADGVSD
jgi:hypothetical protein